jgi:hypothetical protein
MGSDSSVSIVPRSTSRVTERPVNNSMVSVRIVPISPGTMLNAVSPVGL